MSSQITVHDLLNVLGLGFKFTLGELVIELLNASEEPEGPAIKRVRELLARLATYRDAPTAPMPLAAIGGVIAQLAGKAEPRYAALVVGIWGRPWDPVVGIWGRPWDPAGVLRAVDGIIVAREHERVQAQAAST